MNKTNIFTWGILFLVFAGIVFGAESSRVFVLRLNYDNGRIALYDKSVVFGYAPDRKIIEEGYKIELASKNEIIYSTRFEIPLIEILEYSDLETGEMRGEIKKYNNLNFTVVVPYYEDAEIVNVYNQKEFKIIEEKIEEENYLWYALAGISIIGIILAAFMFGKRKRRK